MLQQLARASRRRAASAGSTRAASTAVSYFDKALKLQQRRAALSPEFDYLHDAVAARLVERLNDVKRAFPVALDLGANTGNIVKQLAGHGGIETLHMLDSCSAFLRALCNYLRRLRYRVQGPAIYHTDKSSEPLDQSTVFRSLSLSLSPRFSHRVEEKLYRDEASWSQRTDGASCRRTPACPLSSSSPGPSAT